MMYTISYISLAKHVHRHVDNAVEPMQYILNALVLQIFFYGINNINLFPAALQRVWFSLNSQNCSN